MPQNSHPYILAADIGGSHITAAVIHTSDWSILSDSIVRRRIDSSVSAKSILLTWTETLVSASKSVTHPHLPIGIAMPGPFDYDNGISLIQGQDKYDALHLLNVKRGIADLLAAPPSTIRFINDAAAFLQGEVFGGQHNTHAKILGITLGTGLGSAVWTQGETAVDADLWNTGYQGSIMEEYLATRWFVNTFHRETGIRVNGLKELLQLRAQHAIIDDMLAEYSRHLLYFLNFFSDRERSNRFLIGGNISKAWKEIHAFAPQAFDRFDIHLSKLGEHAALIGAATLFA